MVLPIYRGCFALHRYQYNAATGETRWLDGEATGGGGPDVAVNAGDGTARDNADDEQEEADEPLMSVEEQLAAEDRLKRCVCMCVCACVRACVRAPTDGVMAVSTYQMVQ